MIPMPSPVSALHSISILPDMTLPATKTGSDSVSDTLTLEWNGDAFIGSGLVCMAIVAGMRFAAIFYTINRKDDKDTGADNKRKIAEILISAKRDGFVARQNCQNRDSSETKRPTSSRPNIR